MDFELDPHFEDEILASSAIRDILEDRAEAVASRASKLAPDDPRTVGDDLHSNIKADTDRTGHGHVARVNAFDWKAGLYEFGTRRTPAVHFLSRALEEEVGPLERGKEGPDG